MPSMMNQLSASRRRSLQLIEFTKKMTSLPPNVIAWNGTYTRNSVKTVVQDGALVTLSVKQFGTSYDDVTGLYGYVPEPAATNLVTNSDGDSSTYASASNIANGTAVPGFSNGIAFGDNSAQRYAYKPRNTTAGTAYTVSVFIIMDDGGAPVAGTTNSSGDFCVVVDNAIVTSSSNILIRRIGGGVYRVSGSVASAVGGSSRRFGIVKYTGQSARTFRVTGIQVETGLRATSYIATTGSTASRAADVLSIPLWVNNLLDSQDGSTSNWTRGSCTVTTSGTAPNGTATAQLATASTSGVVTLYQNSTKAPSTTVTYSVYVKQGNKSTCYLLLRNNTTTTNFQPGILTFATGAITGTGWAATDVGNGWFRCTFTQSTGITVGNALRAFVHFTGGGTDTSGDTVYFWGAQIEPGSTATTYRPTTSTLKSVANRNIPGFDSDGYTLFVDMRKDSATNVALTAINMSNQSISDRSQIYVTGNPGAYVAVTAGSVAQALLSAVIPAGPSRMKIAGSYSANNVMGAYNGGALTADTSATMPSGLSMLHIGNRYDSVTQANSFIFSVGVIPQVLTQAQINGLTTL